MLKGKVLGEAVLALGVSGVEAGVLGFRRASVRQTDQGGKNVSRTLTNRLHAEPFLSTRGQQTQLSFEAVSAGIP